MLHLFHPLHSWHFTRTAGRSSFVYDICKFIQPWLKLNLLQTFKSAIAKIPVKIPANTDVCRPFIPLFFILNVAKVHTVNWIWTSIFNLHLIFFHYLRVCCYYFLSLAPYSLVYICAVLSDRFLCRYCYFFSLENYFHSGPYLLKHSSQSKVCFLLKAFFSFQLQSVCIGTMNPSNDSSLPFFSLFWSHVSL